VEPLTSRTNPRVKQAAALLRRKGRRETGLHLAEGPNAVAEALAAGRVTTLFALPEAAARLHVPDDVEVVPVTEPVLDRLADTPSPQGLVAVVQSVVASPRDLPDHGLLVVLHEVADPGNVGTIVRTADAGGAVGVWLTPTSADPFSPKAIRAAAGSTYHLPLVVDEGLDALLDRARGQGREVVGLAADAAGSVADLDATRSPVALVLGNEAHGLDAETLAVLDGTVAVPMRGAAESLNVAAAAAVAIYAAAGALGSPPTY
jgi:RNA methyltransferase, TrmH family